MRRAFVSNKDYSFRGTVTTRAIGRTWVQGVSVVEASTDCVELHDLNTHCCSDAVLLEDAGLMLAAESCDWYSK